MLDLKPHFESVARCARLAGMVRAYRLVLKRMIDAGMHDTDVYRAIYAESMAADENFASITIKDEQDAERAASESRAVVPQVQDPGVGCPAAEMLGQGVPAVGTDAG